MENISINGVLANRCRIAYKIAKENLRLFEVDASSREFQENYLDILRKNGEVLDKFKTEQVIEYLYELVEFN